MVFIRIPCGGVAYGYAVRQALRPTSRSEVCSVQAQVMRVHPETRSPAAYEDADAW